VQGNDDGEFGHDFFIIALKAVRNPRFFSSQLGTPLPESDSLFSWPKNRQVKLF
jgi:hypothetical protein